MLTIRKLMIPESRYKIKSPYKMEPIGIVIHNTWNYAPAVNEIAYMSTNSQQLSFHFAVDEIEAIQALPLNRISWQAGDGKNGVGNRKYISIEICRSRSKLDLFKRAERNGAILTALLLKKYGWDISRVKKHQDFSGKYCPHRTLDLGWKRFLRMVEIELNKLNTPKPSIPKTTNKKVYPGFVGTYVYKGKQLVIREEASQNSKVIGYLYRNSTRDIAEIKGAWGKLKYQEGWVATKFLEKKENKKEKTNEELAREVIAGKWGNGQERKDNLIKAGYNYSEVQKIVNRLVQ